MPLQSIIERSSQAITEAVAEAYGHWAEDVALEIPPRRDLGDLAWPGALPLAKVLRTAPRQIAQTVADKARWPDEIDSVEIAGPGFLNLRLKRGVILHRLLANDGRPEPDASERTKVIVEHTNINPNKAAHIGHLRNSVLGDILVRCLRAIGHPVEVQNYIDDTGVQVADVVVGLLYLPETELAGCLGSPVSDRGALLAQVVRRMPMTRVPDARLDDFDDLCWALYPQVTRRYEADEALAARRGEVLHALEAGAGELDLEAAVTALGRAATEGEPYDAEPVASFAAAVAESNVRCHLATMARLGVAYDLLPHESDILGLGFWQRAFEALRDSGAVRFEDSGKSAGCWVMSLAASPEFADMDDPDKILVRSNGTVTYTAKDIAYQLWKLGLLRDPDGSRHDFGYRELTRWEQPAPAAPVVYDIGEHPLAITTGDPSERIDALSFGAGEAVYNVIDVRQAYPQKVVREAVRVLGHEAAADRSVHFSYEMVALTPAAVRVLEERSGQSFGLSEEDLAKSYVEMSGRRGIGVKADEFLDVLEATAREAVAERSSDARSADDLSAGARAIAVGALRYLMARQSRNRVLAFDFADALAFEGDTGPYLQYSAVRARKIFSKLAAAIGEDQVGTEEAALLLEATVPDDLWDLVLQSALRSQVVEQAVRNLEFSLLAQHAHGLAQLFHKLYHGHPVLREANPELRRLRRAVFTVFVREMHELLERLLGIPIPEEM
jgi:arginyl-tRNA synthetase